MPLTANAIPSQIPYYATPLDSALQFANAQVIAASGYLNNVNQQIDLGTSNPSGGGAGRHTQFWCIDITNINVGGAGDQAYKFALVGSNDVNFANGNVELIKAHDIAATSALRSIPNILGANPAIPPTNITGTLLQFPYTNLIQGIVYRFLRCRVDIVGTGPTVTVSSWLSYAGVKA